MDEIQELRRSGVEIIPCSVRRCDHHEGPLADFETETLYLQPLRVGLLLCAIGQCLRHFRILWDFIVQALIQGREPMTRRIRALFHTLLGAYYALLLEKRGVDHIHVHHGYFSSWIAMVAARLLGISFSMTLHGSDLLVHRAYLDVKLKHCKFCLTVSEFNQRYIFVHYPEVQVSKIIMQHMGVNGFASNESSPDVERRDGFLSILAVGRLHPVKDHAFLLRACHELRKRNIRFICTIAGEGPERTALQQMIVELKLEKEIRLLGHLSRERLDLLYAQSNLVVLTSRSEGIPLVLMEAMSHGKIALAPAITGIPELVIDGKTGFLYRPGSLEHFVERVQYVSNAHGNWESVRDAARQHVLEHFNRKKNLAKFSQLFIERIATAAEPLNYENPLLQQVQLSVQRH
jgi:glycosyltransferase involved in cell wall biosynthesis